MSTTNTIKCLYHYPCHDGIAAALALHLYARLHRLDSVAYYPHTTFKYLNELNLNLDKTRGETLYLLDYAGPPNYAISLANAIQPTSGQVIVLDHHKSALEHLATPAALQSHPENLSVVFDMNRSGSMIALDYFMKKSKEEGVDFDVPPSLMRYFELIQDGDLWTHKIPETKAFYAGLSALNLDYDVNKNPEIFNELLSLDVDRVISDGQQELQRQEIRIQEAIDHSFVVQLGGKGGPWGHCLAVEADSDLAKLRSHLGNQFAELSAKKGLRPVAAICYVEPGMENDAENVGKVKISLRSIGEEDTTVVAGFFNGGGHRNASAFTIDRKIWETWRIDG